jgi:hypothetical protein
MSRPPFGTTFDSDPPCAPLGWPTAGTCRVSCTGLHDRAPLCDPFFKRTVICHDGSRARATVCHVSRLVDSDSKSKSSSPVAFSSSSDASRLFSLAHHLAEVAPAGPSPPSELLL